MKFYAAASKTPIILVKRLPKFFSFAPLFLSFFLLLPFLHAESDHVESLINNEKDELKKWLDEDGDLPPAFLLGDGPSVHLYSTFMERTGAGRLCANVDFDELLEEKKTLGERESFVINFKAARNRASIGESCLIRPGDTLAAVSAGMTRKVGVKDFIVKRARPVCSEDAPFILTLTIDTFLDQEPFFYASDPELKEGDNFFRSIETLGPFTYSDAVKREINTLIQFPEEFEFKTHEIRAMNCDGVVVLKRKSVSSDDSGLPNEILLAVKDDNVSVLISELVDKMNGSGHLELTGVLDYNLDGLTDILVTGTQAGCPYSVLFQGEAETFQKIDLPTSPCKC